METRCSRVWKKLEVGSLQLEVTLKAIGMLDKPRSLVSASSDALAFVAVLALFVAVGTWLPGCTDRDSGHSASQTTQTSSAPCSADQSPSVRAFRAMQQARVDDETAAKCQQKRAQIGELAPLPGTPRLESERHRVLGAARATPVVFLREPKRDTSRLNPYFAELARRLDAKVGAVSALDSLRKSARNNREQVRDVVLPEGYLYTDRVDLAPWLESHLTLDRLFAEDEIWLMRGAQVHRLVRDDTEYRFAANPAQDPGPPPARHAGQDSLLDPGQKAGQRAEHKTQQGEVARLLMFDRVATSREALLPALHVDFMPEAKRLGFDRVRVERITEGAINAKIRYGSDNAWIDSVFLIHEGQATLECEAITAQIRPLVQAFRQQRRIVLRASSRIEQAVQAQVRERLMFDEPKREVGQQDGSLRPLWLWSYRHGASKYTFNDENYSVFDIDGRPHPPQVCTDFILDTYERASGTWYGPRDNPQRTIGTIDFEKLDIENRRSASTLANHFRDNPGIFSVFEVPEDQRVPFARRQQFYDYLLTNADKLDRNSVALILGMRPNGVVRYHSLVVISTDPVTGMPIELGENAGKPRIRSWNSAMRSAPKRSIRYIMTPELSWLQSAFGSTGTGNTTEQAGEVKEML